MCWSKQQAVVGGQSVWSRASYLRAAWLRCLERELRSHKARWIVSMSSSACGSTASPHCFEFDHDLHFLGRSTRASVSCTAVGARIVTSGGTPADFINAFGLRRNTSAQFGLTARAFHNHRIRVAALPIVYRGSIQNTTRVDFGPHGAIGLNGVQVDSEVTWKSTRIGYEWDAMARNSGFVGVSVDFNHSGLSANAHAPGFRGIQEVAFARTLNIPTVGVAGERRFSRYLSAGGNVAAFRLDRWRSETFRSIDVFATANIVRWIGARIGYRSLALDYEITSGSQDGSMVYRESGDVCTRAPYVGAVVRF